MRLDSLFKSVATQSGPVAPPFAARALRRSARQASTPTDLVDLALNFRLASLNIRPTQIRSEIAALCEDVARLRPSTVLETGTGRGGTLFLFAQLAAAGARIVSVDLPVAGGQSDPGLASQEALQHSFGRDGKVVSVVRGDSTDIETCELVQHKLGRRKLDFLFIDGDRSYDGVETDFRFYSLMVRTGGLIAFHDIVPGPEAVVGDVPRFWRDLKTSGRIAGEFVEYVDNPAQGGFGIGVIRNFQGFRIPRRVWA